MQGWRVGYRGVFPDEYLDAPSSTRARRAVAGVDVGRVRRSELYVAELDGRVVGFSHFGPERQQPECDQSGTDQIDAAPTWTDASSGRDVDR